jgi:signal transduction histidine kinase
LGNPELVDVAIRNLVETALRYSPSGSTVSVAVMPVPRMLVDDCGPGIPNTQKELIFERFWRADQSGAEGAGIGPALARQIAHLHSGNISVHDRKTGGARFILSLAPAA